MLRRTVLTGLSAGALAGCGAPARLAPLPERTRTTSSIQGIPADARVIFDGTDDGIMARITLDALQCELGYAEHLGVEPSNTADYLAISGGGENGAYGAGILTAWTETGTRPVFKAVTGVSTGALIAPFAFLGTHYDAELERFYTTIDQNDVMVSRGLVAALFGESLNDPAPLLRTIRSAMTAEIVTAIGREYSEKGRLLFVSTTNLDVPVGVLWNIGGIAATGGPGAPEFIAKILLASASIPGAFPPVMIDVKADGNDHQEMHVDGGTVAQVVFYPPSFNASKLPRSAGIEANRLQRAILNRRRRLFVIRNARPGSDLETVDRSTLKIAGRAISTLVSAQGVGDLYKLYLICQRDNIDYNVAYIPAVFSEKLRKPFDRDYMNKLYRLGRETMKSDRAWSKYPPGFSPMPLSQVHPLTAS